MIVQKRVFLNKRPTHLDKKTVIFDLDETLIHCNESLNLPADVVLPIRFPSGEIVQAGISVRPYAVECLRELSKHFEIIVFTASHSCYANVVLDYLDPQNEFIHHRLFRENCVSTPEGVFIKDLRIFANRSLHEMVLIDNAAYSFGYQLENGIPIVPYYDNKQDDELKMLVTFLKTLMSAKDVRDVNRKTWKLHLYNNTENPDAVLQRMAE
eukprot:TRINITY_DN6365_c0_g1_i16.p2 TRINITY_DN6365_c0_g1~~TRINITY_DN6365_c0_g1_i16.p2  ORF type:complete len:211 (-),score=64.93 TRINITY_DN6365_c0_g1_i16:296-928(-)